MVGPRMKKKKIVMLHKSEQETAKSFQEKLMKNWSVGKSADLQLPIMFKSFSL